MVCDHKKKVRPIFYREGEALFIGKTGFILMGVPVIYQCKHHFYDLVIDGYATQNAGEMQGIICILRKLFAGTIPQLPKLFYKLIMRQDFLQRSIFGRSINLI